MGLVDFYAAAAISSPFGYSAGYDGFHYGTDFEHDVGTEIPTPWDLTVVRCGWQDFHGWHVVGRRPDGLFLSASHMAHDPEYAYGDRIGRRGSMGRVGNTGYSFGAHAHMQLSRSTQPWVHGTETDPWPEIQAALTSTASTGAAPFTTNTQEEEDMTFRVIAHITDEGNTEEVALVSHLLPAGYLTAKGGTDTAAGWLRIYSPRLDGTPHSRMNRAQYLGGIEAAKAIRTAYLAGLPATATIPPIELPALELGDITVTPDPEIHRLLGELLTAVRAPRTLS